jgi:hypothetical protein
VETKAQRREGGGRVLLCDNSRRCGHAAADQVPVCWFLYFNWTPFCLLIPLTLFILGFDLRKILFAPDFPVMHKSRSICIYIHARMHTHSRSDGFSCLPTFLSVSTAHPPPHPTPKPFTNHLSTHPNPAVPLPMPIEGQNNYTYI